MPGFPIRTSSDHSSVDSSPRPIAASHVLHRLLMPRHPPCALKHLFTTRCSHPLCNTQHTTTHPDHQTTTTPTHPPEEAPNALDDRPERRPENNTHTPQEGRLSSQDPTACRTPIMNPPPQQGRGRSNVPPSHTHQPATEAETGQQPEGYLRGHGIVKGEPAASGDRPASPHGETP